MPMCKRCRMGEGRRLRRDVNVISPHRSCPDHRFTRGGNGAAGRVAHLRHVRDSPHGREESKLAMRRRGGRPQSLR